MRDADAPPRLPPFGIACAAAFAAGVVVAMQLRALPSSWLSGVACVAGLAAWFALGRWRWSGALMLGLGWACLQAGWAMSERLPATLARQDLVVIGHVTGLPERHDEVLRFDFIADRDGNPAGVAGSHLRLGWYRTKTDVTPGERWRFTVKLRRPRGVLDPGGFDFEKLALERRIAATGYVTDPDSAHRLGDVWTIDRWRAQDSQRIAGAVPSPGSRFLRALALGDTRFLTEADWDTLRETGLNHQVAISGFHVGVVASFGALLAWLLYWCVPSLGLRWPRPQAQSAMALLSGFGYAAMTGFQLPTVRTLLMIAAALLARIGRRPWSVPDALALALIAMLAVDPLAVLAAGFWLSFAGVAWLLWCLPHNTPQRSERVKLFVGGQGIVSLGLLPLTVWFFGQASLVSPLANLVGIPGFALLVTPLSIFGLALDLVWPAAGAQVLRLAGHAMDALWWVVTHMASWPGALFWLPEPHAFALAMALSGAFWLLLPRGIPGKPLAVLLWLPLLWPRMPEIPAGTADLAMIDVGQGLSLLVRTQHHALLFDTGPAFSGGLDLGESAVVPTMHALGVHRLDALVVSHGDNDHAGGADSVRRAFPVALRYAPAGWPKGQDYQPCLRDAAWTWDGVSFRFLHPPLYMPYLRNDSGCVLRISGPGWAALLPADIEAVVEQRLVREQPQLLRADLLVVPHHGSLTSSTPGFIDAVAPKLALVSVGLDNRFGHPKPAVVQRYVDRRIGLEDTASAGLVRVRLDATGARVVERTRERLLRFWHEPAAPSAMLATGAGAGAGGATR
ncbi:MAG TPA: DNA internalization-related competence protein ComEC/Rec2 [Xanthomonadaceae bacterium]|jgi:competence protein ComEC